jgi:hypothetical protein
MNCWEYSYSKNICDSTSHKLSIFYYNDNDNDNDNENNNDNDNVNNNLL